MFLKGQGDEPDRPVAESPLAWRFVTSLDEAREYACQVKKPLLLELTSLSCGWCRLLTHLTHGDAEVDSLLRGYACVKFICDVDPREEYKTLGVTGFPCTVVFTLDGEILDKSPGFSPPSKFAETLRDWAKRARP